MSTANGNDVAKIIHAMDEEFMRLLASRDVKQLTANFYAEDARLLPPNQAVIVGRPAIQQALEALIAGGLHKIVLQTDKIETAGDFAYGIGRHQLTIKTASGAEIHDEGKYLVVYRRQQDGQWRAVADIFNSDLPAPQQ
jgi:ketosteroid isomerase-like protein